MKYTLMTISAVVTVALVSCEDPAASTTDAIVAEKQVVAEASTEAVTYTFTPASSIEFIGSKMTASHEGGFKAFTGSFQVKDGTPVSGAFTIDMNSIWSDSEKLTGHLSNEDFFNIPKYPNSSFEVTEFKKTAAHAYDVSGNLTMVGVTKNITFPATVTETEEKVTLTSEFDINRKDWGIVYAGMADNLIKDNVVLNFALEAVPQD